MRRVLVPALAALTLLGASFVEPTPATAHAAVAELGTVSGVVTDVDKKRVAGAIVTLTCSGLVEPRETTTNANGLYAFRDVPPSSCTVQVAVGKASQTKIFELPRGAKFRANFNLDPDDELRRVIRVQAQPVKQQTSAGRTVAMEEFRNIPIGNSTSRDYSQVVGGAPEPANREGYAHIDENSFQSPADRPLSTFSIDVDTASYANVRRFISQGQRPPADAVRIEELVNYFDYDYVRPRGDKPFAVNWEIAACPWNPDHLLARIGLKTEPIAAKRTPPRNLVFLIDVSGSMNQANKLPLLKRAMNLLVENLRAEDSVAIVVYAGAAGQVLAPTTGKNAEQIRDAVARLQPGGSTNGAAGIRLAYDLARRSFVRKGINRVVLATDGDFNVGTTSDGELVRLIEQERESGVFLSVLGFGQGNLQDAKMEQLADKGNGNYAYIDGLPEARKVLVEEAGATLVTVAKDVKLQVEFNPAKVAEYRLIGYENRMLADRDFDDDRKDAGEMGAGHTVTALYELVPTTEGTPKAKRRRLRYQKARALRRKSGREWMTVAVRYKAPDARRSKRFEVSMAGRPHALAAASDDLRFAAAVATYGMVLRGSDDRGNASLALAHQLASGARGDDPRGYRTGFVELVDATRRLDGAVAMKD